MEYKDGFVGNWEWEPVTYCLEIPDIIYHYDGTHGLKAGVEKIFVTILEWFFHTSELDLQYFRRVTKNPNKYG